MACGDRKEILFSRLDECFYPAESFSERSLRGKWRAIDLVTNEYSGKMISANDHDAPDISFSPNLSGWYKIYLHLPGRSVLYLKLTDDKCFLAVAAATRRRYLVEEILWRCADMTGQSITLSKHHDAYGRMAILSAIKFVPMTDEEVEAYKRECESREHKRIYATDDIHNRLAFIDHDSIDDWRAVARNYENSDVEWLAAESLATLVADNMDEDDIDGFCYPDGHDLHVQMAAKTFDRHRVMGVIADECRKMGIKSCASIRMGGWGMPYPYDGTYFDCDFVKLHPEWRTRDRNGEEIWAMSYAYPEVRKFIIDELLACAEQGFDAVSIMAHRGVPYLLFEEPVAEKFYELYGEYPYSLPLDEPRLNALHCDIMTGFMRELREALDERFGKGEKQIHFRSLYSIYDSKYVGLDAERWAREGLVDAIISYPQRVHELLDGDVWQDGSRERIDIEKYTSYVRTNYHVNMRPCDFETIEPIVNYRGELCGPKDQRERVCEWMELEKKYGVKLYFEILPRHMSVDQYRTRALDLYNSGADGISLWDTYSRAVVKSTWSAARRLGHKDSLADMYLGEGELYRTLFMLKVGVHDLNRFNPDWGG